VHVCREDRVAEEAGDDAAQARACAQLHHGLEREIESVCVCVCVCEKREVRRKVRSTQTNTYVDLAGKDVAIVDDPVSQQEAAAPQLQADIL
jgi:hypothetical protein